MNIINLSFQNFLFLGRGTGYAVAVEGALKLKEISYIHAEGYQASEMKHSLIALVEPNLPAVFIAMRDEMYDSMVSPS
jgi:glucosamine--fructose-6-phosphate aminotransferase (isomerizing)